MTVVDVVVQGRNLEDHEAVLLRAPWLRSHTVLGSGKTRNLRAGPEIRDQKPRTRNPGPETSDPRPETRVQRSSYLTPAGGVG